MQINIVAPINQLGYGVASLNIVKALWEIGYEVALFPIGQPQVTNQEDQQVVYKSMHVAQVFDPHSPCVRIWHQNQLAEFVGRGLHVGFPIFELDRFDNLENHHLMSCDRLIVCSEWAKKIVIDECRKTIHGDVVGGRDIFIAPLGVDGNVFKPTPPKKKDKVVFLNCGKWEVRKGHDILIKAFSMAYEQNSNIELWMMCSNPFNTPLETATWERLYNHPGVKLIPRAETQTEVYNIMSQADCGVFPSRGEGWNLELLEMMSVGRHVIATKYSAHTEFCNTDNSSLIEVGGLELAYDNKWFFGKGKWAKLDENTIIGVSKAMLDFASSYDFSINKNGVKTAEKFGWKNTARNVIRAVR